MGLTALSVRRIAPSVVPTAPPTSPIEIVSSAPRAVMVQRKVDDGVRAVVAIAAPQRQAPVIESRAVSAVAMERAMRDIVAAAGWDALEREIADSRQRLIRDHTLRGSRAGWIA